MNCIFCDIINNKIPSSKIYEDDFLIAFEDTNPQAPVHILLVPKKHIDNILKFDAEDDKLVTQIFSAIKKIAEKFNLQENGLRIIVNTGVAAGQTVDHVHLHLLGERIFSWPPG
ncbi:MAG: histidine triad nucleotide-binding protein [Candidatus Margulisiibacteriota bacterium]|jgi:histidine triad (HIT) family protein